MRVNQYTCNNCDYSVDHPIDACPVCGAVFYWLIRTKGPVNDQQKADYLEWVQSNFESQTDSSYIFHGGKVWLPHAFWHSFPSGEVLQDMGWIDSLQLVQYKKSHSRRVEAEPLHEESGKGYDTNPGVPVPDLAKPIPLEDSAKEPDEKPSRKTSPETSSTSGPSFLRTYLGPVSLGLFLALLGFSWFFIVLGQHRNHNHRVDSTEQIQKDGSQ